MAPHDDPLRESSQPYFTEQLAEQIRSVHGQLGLRVAGLRTNTGGAAPVAFSPLDYVQAGGPLVDDGVVALQPDGSWTFSKAGLYMLVPFFFEVDFTAAGGSVGVRVQTAGGGTFVDITGTSIPSITIRPPNTSDPNDVSTALTHAWIAEFPADTGNPALNPCIRVGSVVNGGAIKSRLWILELTR